MQPEPHPERLAAPRPAAARALVAARRRRASPTRPEARPFHDARALTEGGNEAEIRLDGVRYVLRITRQGKLILTK